MLIAWDEAVAARLHSCSAAGRLSASCFLQQHAVSERGTAAVVDGRRLLLTPLQHELVPPPMASVVAECPAPTQSVSFRTSADGREVRGCHSLSLAVAQTPKASCRAGAATNGSGGRGVPCTSPVGPDFRTSANGYEVRCSLWGCIVSQQGAAAYEVLPPPPLARGGGGMCRRCCSFVMAASGHVMLNTASM